MKYKKLLDYLESWLVCSILIGVIAGLGAILFSELLELATNFFLAYIVNYKPPAPAGEGITAIPDFSSVRWGLFPAVTAMGGLISGIIVYSFAPEAEGDGTDAVIRAFHRMGGRIKNRVPLVKLIASSITIGSGGSAGREGPISQIGAGFASLLSSLLKLDERRRRILLVSGMGAGIGSIFRSPLGGAIFSVEVLYKHDFEVEALLPAFVSSVVGFGVYSMFKGTMPIFKTSLQSPPLDPLSLLSYMALGAVSGVFALIYIKIFYGTKFYFFDKIPVPKHFRPAIGGLLVGLIALIAPQSTGMGYGWLQLAIWGKISPLLLIIIVITKMFATSFTISSGGSGGVFAPSLVIGGMLGGALGAILSNYTQINPASFVVLGMTSFFAGAAKVPLASIVMVAEMTGGYSMLVPAMLSSVISYVVSGSSSIYLEQVRNRALSPAHKEEFSVPLLKKILVREAMTTDVITVDPNVTAKEALDVLIRNKIGGLPVVDESRRLLGIVTFTDLAQVPAEHQSKVRVGLIMTRDLIVAKPDETLYDAFRRMTSNQLGRLPVVDSSGKIVGILARVDVMRAYERELQKLSQLDVSKQEQQEG
ncbi:MAG: chloride channel protein [Candidatus Methanodesulfokora sp.]